MVEFLDPCSCFWGCVCENWLIMQAMSGERCHPSEHWISESRWDKNTVKVARLQFVRD